MSGIVILGAGEHGKVVADILLSQGMFILGFLDIQPELWGTTIHDLPVLGNETKLPDLSPYGLVAAIGDNHRRQQIVTALDASAAISWSNALHARAVISPWAVLGHGVMAAAGAIINPDSHIGAHSIINTGATVDHDCRIGAFVHLAPGVHLAGCVTVGEGAMIGTGAVVVPGITIGKWAVVGAGAVVVKNIPDGVTAKGVPATW